MNHDDYKIGWICALPTELAAAACMLDEQHGPLPQSATDDNNYTLGRIGPHNVAIAGLPAGVMGVTSAARVAAQMRTSFPSMRFGLMVGIGGGVPSDNDDIRLGDVVVSKPGHTSGGVIQYDFGKAVEDSRFVRTGSLNSPPDVLLNAVTGLQARHMYETSQIPRILSESTARFPLRKEACSYPGTSSDKLYHWKYDHVQQNPTCAQCDSNQLVRRPPRPSNDPVIHHGLIASGNQVMRNGVTRERLRKDLNILCFEMEAAGLMNSFPCLVIRGICDYADSHKNKAWQPYAAAVAAAYAKEILLEIRKGRVAETPTAVTMQRLRDSVNNVDPDQFLPKLQTVDQEGYMRKIPPLECHQPKFYWIFKNMDFERWNSDGHSVLWISGPPDPSIHQVSSHMIDLAQHTVLFFFCSTTEGAKGTERIAATFILTLLCQFIRCSPLSKHKSIIQNFLRTILEGDQDWIGPQLTEEDDRFIAAKDIALKAPTDKLWSAIRTILADDQERKLTIIVDGLDKVGHDQEGFARSLRALIENLQTRISKVQALLTSRPRGRISDALDGLPCIEYNKERKECLRSLRIHNTRYEKISEKHNRSLEWFHTHEQFKEWSTSDTSRLLYVQGKPGSGKSTLMKYFKDHLVKWVPDAKSAIVADFFYTDREGETQRSHYSMLRSILFNILDQGESFFYHFQYEYRAYQALLREHNRDDLSEQHYKSLKRILTSLAEHSNAERLYLIIDAVDESNDKDRRDIFKLLMELCSKSKHVVIKIFIASRPVVELESSRVRLPAHNFIRLQDHTTNDISSFAQSQLNYLGFGSFLGRVTDYIVDHAQGVFLWVKLVTEELLDYAEAGNPENDVFTFLKSLPDDLEDFYEHILKKMENIKREDRRDGMKMFQFVLFAYRPLRVAELHHSLGIPDDAATEFTPCDEHFHRCIPVSADGHSGTTAMDRRIIRCGLNLLEIKGHHENRIVQVMHQTVREYFLRPDGSVAKSQFKIDEKDAHIRISITCIRYLMLCVTNIALAGCLRDLGAWASEDFESYARHLNDRPLAHYALRYLEQHVEGCYEDVDVLRSVSQLGDELVGNLAGTYLLENCLSSRRGNILSCEEAGAASDFRNKVLHAAIRGCFRWAADIALIAGAQVEAVLQGKSPLMLSAERWDDTAMVELLVKNGANTEAKDQSGWTALHWAVSKGHKSAAGLLVEKGAHIEAKDHNGKTPLHWAVSKGHKATTGLLVEKGADMEAKDQTGRTALRWAVSEGHEAIARLLLEKGADIEAKDSYGRTALRIAALEGRETLVRVLVEEGADIEASDQDRQTALHLAVSEGHDMITRLLIEKQAEINAKDQDGRTALHWAVSEGHETATRLLVENGANIEAKDLHRWTALRRSASKGHEAITRLLITNGANIEAKDQKGRTALHWAASEGHEAVARLLIGNGANIEAKDQKGRRALHLAASEGHDMITRLMLENEADINASDRDGRTALHCAAMKGHDMVASFLLEKGLGVESKDQSGLTALHWAASEGYEMVAMLLIARGADLEAKDQRGRTPLHMAALEGRKAVVSLLIEKGAYVDSKDQGGLAPLQWAESKRHKAVAALLREKHGERHLKRNVVQEQSTRKRAKPGT